MSSIPAQRGSAAELLQHPWIVKYTCQSEQAQKSLHVPQPACGIQDSVHTSPGALPSRAVHNNAPSVHSKGQLPQHSSKALSANTGLSVPTLWTHHSPGYDGKTRMAGAPKDPGHALDGETLRTYPDQQFARDARAQVPCSDGGGVGRTKFGNQT
jgi:hypothetical protein